MPQRHHGSGTSLPPPGGRAGIHVTCWADAVKCVSDALGPLHGKIVLEAGCGSSSPFDLRGAHVVGIDVSETQLERNPLLHERIQGSITTYENHSWRGRFDLIVCWNVLEHVDQPMAAIQRFSHWIKPSGQILLAYPNPQTLKGFVTRHTPHLFHRLFYRLVRGTPLFGAPRDCGPFPTVFHDDLRPLTLLRSLEPHGLTVDLILTAESYQVEALKRAVPGPIVDALGRLCARGSPFNGDAHDLVFLLRRTTQDTPRSDPLAPSNAGIDSEAWEAP